MSISKLSLSVIATVALASSVFAADKDVNAKESVNVIGGETLDIKVTGGAKLFYQTTTSDKTGAADLFEQKSAVGQMAFEAGLSTQVFEGMTVNTNLIALDTLGLENDVVNDIASAGAVHIDSDGEYLKTQGWLAEANLNYKTGKTNVIVGRQALNTPLLFTERWNASYNTFDAAVITNSDIPATTLVGAFVGKHNGAAMNNKTAVAGFPSTTTHSGKFYGFGSTYNGGPLDGNVTNGTESAYAAGAIVKPIDNLAINLWYYNVNSAATAYWADASYKIAGVFMGIQNSGISAAADGVDNAMVTAAKIGYGIAGVNFNASFSTTNEGNAGTATIANVATGDKSKVYTQMVFQDGATVGARGTTAWKVHGNYTIAGTKLIAQYQQFNRSYIAAPATTEMTGSEFDLIAKAKLGKYFGLTGIYVHQEVGADTTVKKDAIRLIAYTKF